jgi:hypothetical protein|uniref:E-113 protein n=1 Tax=Saccharomyces cerevisiae TaxID=4932 RepID=E9PA51_YEASX|nr:E-113 protein [Saccharomyces cerevisiae]
MAKSNTTLIDGLISWVSLANEAFSDLGTYFAIRVCNSSPHKEHIPQNVSVIRPGINPNGLNANGIASTPAPHAVWSKVKTPERTFDGILRKLLTFRFHFILLFVRATVFISFF